MISTMNQTCSSSSTATVDSRQSKGASSFARRINSRDFSKTAFPLIGLRKIALQPLFIGVTQFSDSKNWGMSSILTGWISPENFQIQPFYLSSAIAYATIGPMPPKAVASHNKTVSPPEPAFMFIFILKPSSNSRFCLKVRIFMHELSPSAA